MPECIILSPGPGRPEDAGVLIDVIKTMGKRTPILGVCLGHQAICAAYGSKITYAKEQMHGKQSNVTFDLDCPLFTGCPRTAPVARYHSLIADKDTLAHCLKITALTEKGEVMAVQHKEYPVYGVQSVSYTHLDVYKRQVFMCWQTVLALIFPCIPCKKLILKRLFLYHRSLIWSA